MPCSILRSAEPIDAAIMALVLRWAEMRSKDPGTKVGAGVYDSATGGLFLGYNGFPKGVADDAATWNNRDPCKGWTKYDFGTHAEVNAIRRALVAGVRDATTLTLYVTHHPCSTCMRDHVIPAGIRKVVYGTALFNGDAAYWARETTLSKQLAEMAGVVITQREDALCTTTQT